MILIWRGWGLLVVVALFPVLGSCAGLIDRDPIWPFFVALGGSLVLAGAVCGYFGKRWNRERNDHSFYFVPLQWWGWVYLAVALVLALGAVAGAIRQGLDKSPILWQGIGGAVGMLVVIGTGIWLSRLGTNWPPVSSGGKETSAVSAWQDPAVAWCPPPEGRRERGPPRTDYSRLPKFDGQ